MADGDVDLLIGQYQSKSLLCLNDGSGAFTVAAESALTAHTGLGDMLG